MSDDREWVQKVLLFDDRKAYSSLVRKHQATVRAFLLRRTRNLELADDLAQETFLQGYRRLDQLKDGSKFISWILSIAQNQFLQWARAQKNMTSELPDPGAEDPALTAGVEAASLLKSMRPEERSAMILCLGHEYTHTEAAEILKVPLGTVKSLILRAKQKLGAIHGKF